ncbi:hypothetical protein ACFOWE_08620 [Planomonospora corallina]|uniref:Uncharacterized protein n=1 Tax=Planomonospora corallina TaxID=1806052 RepID=A0ABV8I380_9ACTN
MSVPDLIRNVAGKAKELPLYVIQTTLNGIGQALLLGDRFRSKLKRTAGEKDGLDETSPEVSGQETPAAEKTDEKPARREPVIFAPAAPRTKPAETTATETKPAETKPAETKPAETATSETATSGTPATGSEAPAPAGKAGPAAAAEAAPATDGKPAEEEAPAAGSNGGRAATEPVTLAPAAPKTPRRKASGPEPVVPTPPAVKVEVAEVDVEVDKPDATGAAPVEAEVEVVKTKPAEPDLAKSKAAKAKKAKAEASKAAAGPAAGTAAMVAAATAGATDGGLPFEPLPGYAGLTVASLRARMRGKSIQQIRDMIAYEKATTARPEVVRMFENRLAKLEAGE